MTTNKRLYVNKLTIENILGIERLEVRLGKFTVVTGANGQGKSSVIESVKAALKGGHDATLLRNGSERGYACLVLDNGIQISKSIAADKSTSRVIDEDGDAASRPAEALKDLVNTLSVNPLQFLTADGDKQIATLLEAMPLKADSKRLAEITGRAIAPELANAHAMIAIETVHDQVFDDRTGTNRSIKDKQGTIRQLEAAIPAELADVDAVDETTLEAALAAADKARDEELKRVDDKLAGMEVAWQTDLDAYDKKITDLRETFDREVAAVRASIGELKTLREQVRSRAEKQRGVTRELCSSERKPIDEKLAVIRANRDNAAKARSTRETIDKMKLDLQTLEKEQTDATLALASLDAYRSELLGALPIPGLVVREGAIYYNGVIFSRVNTAGKMKVAAEITKLRAGKLGLVCVDGIEALDQESFEAFRESAMDSDLQFIVTRVGEGPLRTEVKS